MIKSDCASLKMSLAASEPPGVLGSRLSRAVRLGRSNSNHSSLLLLAGLTLLAVGWPPTRSLGSANSPDYYAHLPKVGHLRGLRLAGEPNVVAFLNIAYASPPVGLLRFMPPGAPSFKPSQQQQMAGERRLLWPSGQLSFVRSQRQFGRECVSLPDWLESPDEQASNKTGGKHKKSSSGREMQSEDCLNLNVFVPIREEATNALLAEAMSQHIKTNQPASSSAGNHSNNRRPLSSDDNQAGEMTQGFLPYVDAASDTTRNNHAIWDQIGLLDWLRRNVAHFEGDPNNITLLAADNQASLFIQLLCMTPHAKGLFRRVLLVRDDRTKTLEGVYDNLSELIGFAQEARDSRRKLSSSLRQIIQQLTARMKQNETSNQSKQQADSQVGEFISSANLRQLAEVDKELKQSLPKQVVGLSNAPSLDDKFLFPQLSFLIKFQNLSSSHFLDRMIKWDSSLPFPGNPINYCLYMRKLYDFTNSRERNHQYDELDLIPNKQLAHDFRFGDKNWHRDSKMNFMDVSSFVSKSNKLYGNFNYLRNLHLLSKLIDRKRRLTDVQDNEVVEKEHQMSSAELHVGKSLRRRSINYFNNPKNGTSEKNVDKRSSMIGGQDQLTQLLEFMSSLDVLLTHFYDNSRKAQNDNSGFLFLLKWLDVVYASEFLSNEDFLVQFCDMFSTHPIRRSNFYLASIDTSNQNTIFNVEDGIRNWLLESVDETLIVEAMKGFIKSGDLNSYVLTGNSNTSEIYWPNYDTLSRSFKQLVISSTRGHLTSKAPKFQLDSTESLIRFHLDVWPFLRSLSTGVSGDFGFTKSVPGKPFECLSEVPLNGTFELDKALDPSKVVGAISTPKFLECFRTSLNFFRGQLRQYAAEDLEPLAKFFEKQHQDGANKHSKVPPLITTRNLPTNDVVEYKQGNNQEEQVSLNNNSTFHVTYLSPRSSANNSSTVGALGEKLLEYWTGTYRRMTAKAWAIVIGTAISLLLLNIFIVLVIAFTKRRQQTVGEQILEASSVKISQKRSSIKKQANNSTFSIDGTKRSGFGTGGKKTTFNIPNENDQIQYMHPQTNDQSPTYSKIFLNGHQKDDVNYNRLASSGNELILSSMELTDVLDRYRALEFDHNNYISQPVEQPDWQTHHCIALEKIPQSPAQTRSPATSETICSRMLSCELAADTYMTSTINCPHQSRGRLCQGQGHFYQASKRLNLERFANGKSLSNWRETEDYPPISPGSLTTLSVTPTQNNSNNVNGVDSSQTNSFAMEPITLIYPTDEGQKNLQIYSGYVTKGNVPQVLLDLHQEDF